MKRETLEKAIHEAKRFIKKAEELLDCTRSAQFGNEGTGSYQDQKHYEMYKNDAGLKEGSEYQPSKRRASVRRSCIDLRDALSDTTQGRYKDEN